MQILVGKMEDVDEVLRRVDAMVQEMQLALSEKVHSEDALKRQVLHCQEVNEINSTLCRCVVTADGIGILDIINSGDQKTTTGSS